MLRLIKLTTSIGTAETIVVPEDPRIMEITQVLMDEFAEEEEEEINYDQSTTTNEI
jgi:hypothetical protein